MNLIKEKQIMKSKVPIISTLLITTFGFNSVAKANDSLVEIIDQQNQQEIIIAKRSRSNSSSSGRSSSSSSSNSSRTT